MTLKKHFHIFGQSISQSLSPTIHNAAFTHHDLPYLYHLQECNSLDEVKHFISDEKFGGASITMPHKLGAGQFCNEITESARKIGAINTLVLQDKDKQRMIFGDNTDWSGLHSIIMEYVPTACEGDKVGLVIGAGGAARAAVYAMIEAGVSMIYIFNRTVDKARRIMADFGATDVFVTAIGNLSEVVQLPDIIIGTIPGEVTNEDMFGGLFRKEKGLCIEMSYKPRTTPLLSAARRHPGWAIRDGLEVLLRQAFDQYRLWTGIEAPEGIMRSAIHGGPYT